MNTTRQIRIFAAAAAAFGLLASCQQQEAENPGIQEELVPVSLTASFSTVETKVSYTETTTGGIKLQPAWKVGDEVIGFDGANKTYTFSVSEVAADGTATLDGECPASCTLHLIYLCGATKENITDGSLNVSYESQAGTGGTGNVYTMPAVMLADGTVTSGSGDFHFSNAGAVIGVKAVKGVPSGSTVSSITVSGEDLSAATIALDGSSKLKLTATTAATDTISTAALSGVTVEDADGTLSKPVLIAVPADAKVSKVTAAVGGATYSFKLAKPATLAAGKYSYINGGAGQTFTYDRIPVSSISLSPTSKTIAVGENFTITATVSPSDATDKTVTWTSSDDTIATVDASGKVTAVAPGTATITAKVGDETATFTVTVAPAVGYVEIEAKYDGTNLTKLKWATQNLSISDSGKKSWKGGNTTAVKVPGTDEDVQVGDYFQWAAFAGYCGNATDSDKGLLIYDSFTNTSCVGDTGSDGFSFKSGKQFNQATAPYHSGSAYDSKYSVSTNTELESSDDVAHIILGGKWRMPTSAEFKALYDATKWTWSSNDRGYYLTKKGETLSSDKSNALLFFPVAGDGYNGNLNSAGSNGRYWFSSLNSGNTTEAYLSSFNGGNVNPQYIDHRCNGYSVRPVSD